MIELPARVRALLDSLQHNAEGSPALRRAAVARAAAAGGAQLDGEPLPDGLAAWVDAVASRAWEITDDDLARAKAAGFDEDALYEVTVSAAVGAAVARMEAGLRALRGSR